MEWLARERDLRFTSYQELWRWSVTDLDAFWSSIWDFFKVRSSRPYERVLARDTMPGASWFPGAELNYAEHALARRDDHPALIARSETRGLDRSTTVTYAELAKQVAAVRAGLMRLGVTRGDRVVAYMPNIPETVVALLATSSLGAIWSSCSPDFGTRAVVDRFGQLDPKVLFAVDGYRYGGRDFDRARELEEIERGLPSLSATVVLPYLRPDATRPRSGIADVVGGACVRDRAARVRAASVRASAVGPLHVRDHRSAEGSGAQPGRDPARAPQVARAAPGSGRRRSLLLVHDDRLDDVELHARRAAARRHRGPLRRQSGVSGHADALAFRRGRRCHVLRNIGRFHPGVHEGGHRAGRAGIWERCAASARRERRSRRRVSRGSSRRSGGPFRSAA